MSGKQEARGPYVEFEERAIEDRAETVKQGTLVMKSVDYAILRALGSKDTVEKPALEWLQHIKQLAQRGEYPGTWVKFYSEQYQEWKDGGDASKVNGLHVRHWSAISRAQAEVLIASRILTVEDLAAAPEEALQRIGMGARDLKARAQAHLDAAQTGKAAEELASLRQENVDLKDQLKELNDKVEKLVDALAAREGSDEAADTEQPRRRRRA